MTDNKIYLHEGYKLAGCCNPEPEDAISGYYSHNNEMIIHSEDCPNLHKVEPERIIKLEWKEILAKKPEEPDKDYSELNELDFIILAHHEAYGNDYSLKVARMLNKSKQEIFDSHAKLRNLRLLTRVKPSIIQYRKGVVDNKWIKHRNHTYYDLTDKGRLYLDFHRKND